MGKRKNSGDDYYASSSGPPSADTREEPPSKWPRQQPRIRITGKPEPTLLGIPGELRNRIYRLVLVEELEEIDYYFAADKVLLISEASHTAPALLRTSRQLRQEAADIFYLENSFELIIEDLKFAPHHQHWVWTSPAQPYLSCRGEYSWDTFVHDWLRPYWKQLRYGCRDAGLNWAQLVEALCEDISLIEYCDGRDMVEMLAADGSAIRWSTVEEVLEFYNAGVTRYRDD